jgi:hypothetical protein
MAVNLGRQRNLGELRYKGIYADSAVTIIQEKKVQAEKERETGIQRKRLRAMLANVQMNIEKKDVAMAQINVKLAEQEWGRMLLIEAQRAEKAVQSIAHVLESTFMEERKTLDRLEKEIFQLANEQKRNANLLPSQRGAIKPDSHSVFNQLIAPDDPMDGSRLLRKRKTSSADVNIKDTTVSRRRIRNKDNSGSNVVHSKDELSEPNVFAREAKGSNSEQNNRVSTSLSNSTAPEKVNDFFSKQSETSGPYNDRDDVPSGHELLALVDPNRAVGMFSPVLGKPWEPSEPFSSINYTISRDNTAGEYARQAKLFADFGQKLKMKPCGF